MAISGMLLLVSQFGHASPADQNEQILLGR